MDEVRLSDAAIARLDRLYKLRSEACQLLGVIAMEFKTDPTSVQCFDLRIVERAIAVTAELDDFERTGLLP